VPGGDIAFDEDESCGATPQAGSGAASLPGEQRIALSSLRIHKADLPDQAEQAD